MSRKGKRSKFGKRQRKRERKLDIIRNSGEECPKCGIPMELRSHKEITPKQLRQPYYFSQWDFCRKCRHVQHYEKYKVVNETETRLENSNFKSRAEIERTQAIANQLKLPWEE